MSKIVLAFDSFKGALSAADACASAATGIARLEPEPETILCPLSDGGEGFATAMQSAGSTVQQVMVTGPLFSPVSAELVFLDDGQTAVVESAQVCGLGLVPREKRSPLRTTTLGLGELMAVAVREGARRLVIGLGGSATNDGGLGMLTALGWRFLDAHGQPVRPAGAALGRVMRIEPGCRLQEIEIVAACDVTNPLYGPHGAAYTFAPQKGASPRDVATLDAGLQHFARVVAETLGADYAAQPGAGAAGGLGFALLACLGASFRPGAELAINLTGLEAHLRGAALCLTGEGQTDVQTAYGKLPAAVAARCVASGVPCVCLSGALGEQWRALYEHGFTALFSICRRPQPFAAAIAQTADALADAAEAVARLTLHT